MKNINLLSIKAPDGIKKPGVQLLKLHQQQLSLKNLFYREGKHALLVIIQRIGTSGKDATTRHVSPVLILRDAK